MNDDDYNYWLNGRPYSIPTNTDWDGPSMISQISDMLNQSYKQQYKKDAEMAYSYNRGYYNNTRGDEVATAVLEAYANGVEFETLIKKNSTVRQYWHQVQSDKILAEQYRIKEQERLNKLAEKRKIAAAKKAEVMKKLSPEELEAFGLVKKGRKK